MASQNLHTFERVPFNKELLTGTVPVNKKLLNGTVLVNNLFLNLLQTNLLKPRHDRSKSNLIINSKSKRKKTVTIFYLN